MNNDSAATPLVGCLLWLGSFLALIAVFVLMVIKVAAGSTSITWLGVFMPAIFMAAVFVALFVSIYIGIAIGDARRKSIARRSRIAREKANANRDK